MARVMPSQLVRTIDELFPHAAKDSNAAMLTIGANSKLLGILNLLKSVPDELMTDLVLAQSTIEETLEHWRARGDVGAMDLVKGHDAVTIVRRALAKCRDEVLAGAAIEALLHWRLQEPLPGPAAAQSAVAALVSSGVIAKPDSNIDRWELHHFIEVAAHLKLLKPDTRRQRSI